MDGGNALDLSYAWHWFGRWKIDERSVQRLRLLIRRELFSSALFEALRQSTTTSLHSRCIRAYINSDDLYNTCALAIELLETTAATIKPAATLRALPLHRPRNHTVTISPSAAAATAALTVQDPQ